MKSENISGQDFFKKILDDFQQKTQATQRDQVTKNLFEPKCRYCGKKFSKNITMEFCSLECFQKNLQKF